MSKQRIFSGVQPTGDLTIGNYLGALRHFAALQDEGADTIYCVVDMHAITVPQDPEKLRKKTLEVAGIYLASGIDPNKSTIFVQSHVHQHAELSWILECASRFGELSRMTQFKEKGQGQETVGVGLFTYPVLMAADILIYKSTHVPVGDDQKQHLELARDLAERFNNRYGETFVIPEPMIGEVGARIMALDEPQKKMSKSAESDWSRIALLDAPNNIRKKIMRAVTDTDNEIRFDQEHKPGISNLLSIYSSFSGESIASLEKKYEGQQYGTFKKDLAEVVVTSLEEIQRRYHDLSEQELLTLLRNGAEKAAEIAEKTVKEVKEKIGFIL